MSNLVKMKKKGLINPPDFVHSQLQYETVMGSVSYGVSDVGSDLDIYGFCIPNKDMVFPHIKGEVFGFGRQTQRFDQFQQHHVDDKDTGNEYDFSIYSIIKYFQLCMENNPNIIDSLFTPRRCITHSTKIGEMVRENRKLFLHKGCWHKFKGYSFSQMHKMRIKNPEPGSKRYDSVMFHKYDLKFAYHVVRLLGEVEQILIEHDLDLERNREQLKSIRRGEWELEDIEEYFQTKEKELESVYLSSTLQYKPDEDKIKQLLINCLEEHFGSLKDCVIIPNSTNLIIADLQEIIQKYQSQLGN